MEHKDQIVLQIVVLIVPNYEFLFHLLNIGACSPKKENSNLRKIKWGKAQNGKEDAVKNRERHDRNFSFVARQKRETSWWRDGAEEGPKGKGSRREDKRKRKKDTDIAQQRPHQAYYHSAQKSGPNEENERVQDGRQSKCKKWLRQCRCSDSSISGMQFGKKLIGETIRIFYCAFAALMTKRKTYLALFHPIILVSRSSQPLKGEPHQLAKTRESSKSPRYVFNLTKHGVILLAITRYLF